MEIYHSFWIYSFADGHLGCFQYLAIVNCAAMNIGMHWFFWIGGGEWGRDSGKRGLQELL